MSGARKCVAMGKQCQSGNEPGLWPRSADSPDHGRKQPSGAAPRSRGNFSRAAVRASALKRRWMCEG